jgi:hypothetical protein
VEIDKRANARAGAARAFFKLSERNGAILLQQEIA